MSETVLPLGERLRKVASDDRTLAQRANEYFHFHQESAGWYNAVIKGEYQDRSDYAPTLERCALLEEAANMLDGAEQSNSLPRGPAESNSAQTNPKTVLAFLGWLTLAHGFVSLIHQLDNTTKGNSEND